ncbi:MAG: iron-containing alcohol dehydrogenase, partial [Armatimonadetes bacterium]|nr:iron-containing alcohol dehydrogenase [Armatimonadota bacterium]
VVTLLETKKKAAIRADAIYARVAIDDPRLTYTVPPRVTAATGVDVLCHALEGFLSTQRQAITDVAAPRAIALVLRWLPEAVANGDNAEAREQMLLANVLAGYALSQSGATALHGLEHPVSAHHPEVPHGEGLAAMLPGYLRAMIKFAPERLAELAEALRLPTDGPAAKVAGRVLSAAEKLLEQVGLQLTLRELGVEDDELGAIVEGAQDYMAGALAKTPGGALADTLMEILEQSL